MVRLDPPADVVASWPPPNFDNPVRAGVALNVIAILFLVLAYLFVGLRVYVRAFLLRTFGLDDWLMVLCLFTAMALAISSYISTDYGWGIHAWDQKPENYAPSELISWIIQLMFISNMFLTKEALLVSYLRFCRPGKFRITVYVAIFAVVAWFVASMLTTIFACWPIKLYWTQHTYDHCGVNDNARLLSSVLVNILTDLLVCLLPLRIVWQIRIAKREKVVLYILLSLGLIATIASCVRTVVMDKAISTNDITWWGYYVWMWTCIECDLAIICACVPCLRPLSKKFFFFLKSSGYYGKGTTSPEESHRMEDFSKKSNRRSVRELEPTSDMSKEPRIGTLPSASNPSEESFEFLDPELHPRDYIMQMNGQSLVKSSR